MLCFTPQRLLSIVKAKRHKPDQTPQLPADIIVKRPSSVERAVVFTTDFPDGLLREHRFSRMKLLLFTAEHKNTRDADCKDSYCKYIPAPC